LTTNTATPGPSTRALYAACASGASTNAIGMMLRVIVPLWALQLQMSPTMIGIAIGASGFLPFLLSIHGGVVMDRFGVRRVNILLAFVAAIAILLYPVLPFASALIALQMITGLTTTMGWMGAQSMIAKVAPGNTDMIGRFSLTARVGNLVAPVIAGVLWDLTGPVGTFSAMAACAMLAFIAFYVAPSAEVDAGITNRRPSVRDLFPRASEYVETFSMLMVPAIAFVCAITFVRIAGSGVHSSFYLVYLDDIGITGTMIGILVGLGEGAGIFGASIAGKIERALKPHWTLIVFHAVAVIAVCITPFLGGIMLLLVLFATLRGLGHGLGQPVMFSALSRAVTREQQARSVGLRTTVNRIATMGVPPIMGAVAEFAGVTWSFVIMGAGILGFCAALALVTARMKDFKT
jgi:predicted MFS family arabinose efflux permease